MVTIDDILSDKKKDAPGNTPTSSAQQQPTVQVPNEPPVNGNSSVQPTTPVQQASAPPSTTQPSSGNQSNADTPIPPKREMTYVDLVKRFIGEQEPTEAQKKAMEKKKRRDAIFSALGDGISAFANLYYTTKDAPNMYNPSESLSERNKKRYKEMDEERKGNRINLLNAYMRAAQADDAKAAEDWRLMLQLGEAKDKAERDKKADERAEAKENRDKEMHNLNKQLMDKKITKAEYEAGIAKIEEEYAPEYQRSRISKNNRANRGEGSNKYYGEFRGKDYKTQADYEKAVLDAAKERGVKLYEEEVQQRNNKGVPIKTRRINRSIADIAAEVMKRDEEQKELNSYKRGKKNNLPPLN